jgi:hypothetical protein
MAPYKAYGLYIHPIRDNGKAVVATLSADPLDMTVFANKGFVYLGPVPAPGITAGPRDIDRDDSGMPKGPDGSTHDRHPDEVTPDGAPVPWGFPMLGLNVPDSTLRTRGAVEAAGLHRGASNAGEADVRRKLREQGVTDNDQVENILGQLRGGGLVDPQHEVRKLHQQATLPGEIVEKGVTRGMTGVDLSMPPIVSGATAAYDPDSLERRGLVETREVEVAPGEVVMQQFSVNPAPVPQAPGDPPVGTPMAETVEAAQKAAKAEGADTPVAEGERPKSPRPSARKS